MLQVIGTRKDKNTQKAERYLKERRIAYQFVDISEKRLSEKEWKSIFASASSPEALINRNSSFYKKKGYEYMDYDPVEELIEHPELLVLPVLRNGQKCVFTLDEDFIREASR